MTRSDLAALAALPALVLLAASARAQQSLAQRVAAVSGDAQVRFASRPEVCGDGERSFSFRSEDDWNGRCVHGPVRVRLTVANGAVTRLRTSIGEGRESRDSAAAGVTDLGTASTHAAVEYFLGLARAATTPERVAADAILPAALADSTTIAPALLSLAKDRVPPTEVRKRALFWAGEVGEPGILEPVRAIARDSTEQDAMRDQAVFVMSQLPHDSGVPALIAIARDAAGSMHIRKRAMFWLGQTNDPRVATFLASILEH